MKASLSLSDLARRLEPRERRVVVAGAIMSGVAVAIVCLVLPFAQRWTGRETRLAATQDRWVRLATLAASTGRLRLALDAALRTSGADQSRLISGATPALAASALQAVLQKDASQSAVQLERVDAAGDPQPDQPGLLAIPVQLQARGDLYALVDFLGRLETGAPLLVVDELTVDAGSDGGDDDGTVRADASSGLAWTLRIHGLYATSEEATR
jgi:type II secretory pathway component PulM